MKTSLLLAAIAFTGTVFAQGPLSPPSGANPAVGPVNALTGGGAPQGTMKTLHQVEPRTPITAGSPGVTQNANGGFTITQAGSYYLTANLAVSAGDGIIINDSPTALDLNGFRVASTASPSEGIGVKIGNGGARNVRVMNGSIVGITTNSAGPAPRTYTPGGFIKGIGWSDSSPDLIDLDHLIIEGIGGHGIDVLLAKVFNCRVFNCAGTGIIADDVGNTEARVCGGAGIQASFVRSSSAIGCNGNGISLSTFVDAGNRATDCTSCGNYGVGIVGDHGTVTNCVANKNHLGGIGVSQGQISHCSASENEDIGINSDSGAIDSCVANGNWKDGISADNSSIAGCSARDNKLNGIKGFISTVTDCTVRGNGVDGGAALGQGSGITVPNGVVKGCNAYGNTQNGIFAPGGFVTLCRSGGNGGAWSNIYVAVWNTYAAGLDVNNF